MRELRINLVRAIVSWLFLDFSLKNIASGNWGYLTLTVVFVIVATIYISIPRK